MNIKEQKPRPAYVKANNIENQQYIEILRKSCRVGGVKRNPPLLPINLTANNRNGSIKKGGPTWTTSGAEVE